MAHELEQRMRAQEVGFATLTQAVDDNTKMVGTLLTKHDVILLGKPGDKDSPGLVTRVDREEQNTKRQKKTFWIFCSALIGIVGKFVYDAVAFFFNHPH